MLSNKEQAFNIINTASGACAFTGGLLMQAATVKADAPILTSIQIKLAKGLAALGHYITSVDIVACIGTQIGASVGAGGARALLGWAHGLGNLANANVTFAHAEAMGWVAYKHSGRT
jgi:hypothetical protein